CRYPKQNRASSMLQMSEQPSSRPALAPEDDPLAAQLLELVESLQAELNDLREQLAWSNRLGQLGMLTAALAHETNNFLTPVRSYAQLAMANREDKELTQRALQAAVDATQKVSELANRAVGLASPNGTLETGVCMIDETLESAIASILPVIKQRRVKILARIEPIGSRMDALALEQVLINLISNACQAMSGTPGRREVLIESEQGDGRVILTIADTGRGISPDIRDNLFEAFVTANSNGSAVGSGLGLCICKQLVEAAGGEITLASSSEQGSTFKIDLPAKA
ncbi:MAG: sensor histidine kinase, partial [Phycisphaeraceae bacterium]